MNIYYRLRYSVGLWKKRLLEALDSFRWRLERDKRIRQSKEQLRRLKGAYRGKRCFVVGNGPSLNQMDLNLLRNEYIFVSNSFFLKFDELDFRPHFYIVEDHLVAEDNRVEIESLGKIQKFYPFDLRRTLRLDDDSVYVNFPRAYGRSESQFPKFGFDADDRLYWGGTVTYFGIQLAAHMGFDEIILIGVDLTYKIPKDVIQEGSVLTSQSDDPNHFHSNYFGKGKRWHLPEVERMQRSFDRADRELRMKGKKLINATVGGQLKSVERVDYASLFVE